MDEVSLFELPEEVKSDLRMKLSAHQAHMHTIESFIAFLKESEINNQTILPFLSDRTEKIIYDDYDKAVYLLDWSENGFITTFKQV